MRNEYNMKLDGNGYAKSILHEVFGGPDRAKSKRYGLWVLLCHDRCHLNGVHKGASLRVPLQREAQMAAMKKYKWDTDEFIRIFGRSYL